jgi:predicted SAM-dependent methyltransferase
MDRLVARLRVEFRIALEGRLCGNRQCSDHQPWNGSPAPCLCEASARLAVETMRHKIEAEYLSAKDPETFTRLVRQLFRNAVADDVAIKEPPPVRHADAVTRLDRQERRPVAAPNTTPPHTTTALYLRNTPAGRRGINFGCGGMTFKDWLNIDFDQPHHVDIAWDLAKGMPFLPDNQFDAVYSEAFLEHVSRRAAMAILNDSFRALRPGGHIRIAIPDLELWMNNYHRGSRDPFDHSGTIKEEYGAVFGTRCELFNVAMRAWGHTYMYDREEINRLFLSAGFVDVHACDIRQSAVPLLHNRENRPWGEVSLITEGRKPG